MHTVSHQSVKPWEIMNSCSNAEGKQVLSYHKHKRRQNYSTYDIKLLLRLKMKQEGFSLPL